MNVVKEGHQYSIDSDHPVPMIIFQDGTVSDFGRNGWQNSDVLEVLIDRIKYINKMFSCRENSIVITKLEEALMWDKKRTDDRVVRGVEGKHVA